MIADLDAGSANTTAARIGGDAIGLGCDVGSEIRLKAALGEPLSAAP